jgi:hypothetical protein
MAGKRFLSIEIEHCFSGHFVDVHYWPSGHAAYIVECLLLGVKRTWRLHCEMSAYDPKQTSVPVLRAKAGSIICPAAKPDAIS